jgi:gliding motility-associated-like protein
VEDGDQGTGDGRSACFGYNNPGCIGMISSVRLLGTRPNGSFGLGIDNFSFCGEGVDIVTGVQVETNGPPCESGLGSIIVTPPNNSGNTFSYSIDEVNFQSSNEFNDLPPGDYTITVLSDEGCKAEIDTELKVDVPITIISSIEKGTKCNQENGSIQLEANYPSVQYSIDGMNFQESGLFENLAAGDYVVTVIDENDCIENFNFTIADSPEIILVELKDKYNCVEGNYTLTVVAEGSQNLQYFIDSEPPQFSPIFENVSTGYHQITIFDEYGCVKSTDLLYNSPPPIKIPEVEVNEIYCNNPLATATLLEPSDAYEYNIDNGDFSDITTFENLNSGLHTISVKDENDCIANIVFEVIEIPSPKIINASIVPTKCNESNGEFELFVNDTFDGLYKINEEQYQDNPSFTDLAAGDYLASIIDTLGCEDEVLITIPASTPLILKDNYLTLTGCEENENYFSVEMEEPYSTFTILINGELYNNNEEITGLPYGEYEVKYMDVYSCTTFGKVRLDPPANLFITNIATEAPDCGVNNGKLSFEVIGGNGEVEYYLDSKNASGQNNFENLEYGSYELLARDSLGCEARYNIEIPVERCDVIAPNIFSPNNDGINDFFQFFSIPNYNAIVEELKIFDRWGSLVFSSELSENISNEKIWWDGKFNGIKVVAGVYVYTARILHPNGETEILSGDITIVQ